MNRSSLALVLLSVLLLGVSLTLFAYYGFYLRGLFILEHQEMKVDFRVQQGIIGLDADTDALHFGTIAPGGSSERLMTVTPARDARLVITFAGDAAPYLSVDKNDIRVVEGEPIELNFTVTLPGNMSDGNYTGEAKLYFYRP